MRHLPFTFPQLERLNKEATGRAKRARRRANELRTRTIQRMQLQMTAPLDIGLEHQDPALHMGQDDTFDLSVTERAMSKKGGAKLFVGDADKLNGKEEES